MEYALAGAYGMEKLKNWKRAEGPIIVMIVFAFILGMLGLGVAAYCAYRGMNFEFATMIRPGTIRLACRR